MTGDQNIKEKGIWIWGIGNLFKEYVHMLDPKLRLVGICDADLSKQGNVVEVFGKEHIIKAPREIQSNDAVIICVIDRNAEKQIREVLNKMDIECCHIIEAVDEYWTGQYKEPENNKGHGTEYPPDRMMKFVDCFVPIDSCNLRCSYCYIGQHAEFTHRVPRFHSAAFIRRALSRERMGGTIFINFCGVGETLLCPELLPIVEELVKEGHYVQIVTNATISRMVEQYLNSGIDLSHVFFKCSFHYLQLKQRELLDVFSDNVKKMYGAGASVTVEITPEDDLIPYIEEVKEYSIKEFGALPHITVARDERYDDLRILSKYSEEEYIRIWSAFESPMFDFKMSHRKSQKENICKAGLWAVELDLETGHAFQCVGNSHVIGNVYDLTKDIEFEEIGKGCCLPHCFNCHAYLTLGLIPEENAPTYFEMRDRVTVDNKHWVNETMQKIFMQKLYENNSMDK